MKKDFDVFERCDITKKDFQKFSFILLNMYLHGFKNLSPDKIVDYIFNYILENPLVNLKSFILLVDTIFKDLDRYIMIHNALVEDYKEKGALN